MTLCQALSPPKRARSRASLQLGRGLSRGTSEGPGATSSFKHRPGCGEGQREPGEGHMLGPRACRAAPSAAPSTPTTFHRGRFSPGTEAGESRLAELQTDESLTGNPAHTGQKGCSGHDK